MSVTDGGYRGIVLGTAAISLGTALTTNANTWYEVIASTTSSVYLTGVTVASSGFAVVDVATGAAASEAVVATVGNYSATAGDGAYCAFTIPIRVAANTRVAIRSTYAGRTLGITYVAEGKVV